MSESFARVKSRWLGSEPPPHMYIVLYMHPNDIRRGTNLWLILTDNTFEQFDENHDFDQIDGNYTLENYMEKGALLSKRGASSDSNVIRTETTFGSNSLTFSWYVFMVPSLWYDASKARRAVVPFIWK